jgi:hypothetical protein
LVEQLPFKQMVAGSIPAWPTKTRRSGFLETISWAALGAAKKKSVNFLKVRFWCGYTIPVEPTLSKIPEKIQSPIAPHRRFAAGLRLRLAGKNFPGTQTP